MEVEKSTKRRGAGLEGQLQSISVSMEVGVPLRTPADQKGATKRGIFGGQGCRSKHKETCVYDKSSGRQFWVRWVSVGSV